eukprot:3507308-Heterocapsa_arctica.AAC.1
MGVPSHYGLPRLYIHATPSTVELAQTKTLRYTQTLQNHPSLHAEVQQLAIHHCTPSFSNAA